MSPCSAAVLNPPWSKLSHSSMAILCKLHKVCGHCGCPKTTRFYWSHTCSIRFMSGKQTGHSILVILACEGMHSRERHDEHASFHPSRWNFHQNVDDTVILLVAESRPCTVEQWDCLQQSREVYCDPMYCYLRTSFHHHLVALMGHSVGGIRY